MVSELCATQAENPTFSKNQSIPITLALLNQDENTQMHKFNPYSIFQIFLVSRIYSSRVMRDTNLVPEFHIFTKSRPITQSTLNQDE